MLDIGWWELMVVGMIALIVVGPNELPALLRTIGRYVGLAKRQADDFRNQFNDALRESEFNDLRDEVNSIQSGVAASISEAEESVKQKPSETDHDWDKEEPIKPAPEFADDEPTTSFTMADGTVVTKRDDSESAARPSGGLEAPTENNTTASAEAEAPASPSATNKENSTPNVEVVR